jgi:RNase P/RNase MRP subunit POP5
MFLSPPVTTVALQTTPAINALSHVMRPKSQRPRRPVLRPLRKGVVVVVVAVVVVAVVVVAMGGVEAVIVKTLGTSGAHTVAPQTLVQIKLQVMELRRGMGRG